MTQKQMTRSLLQGFPNPVERAPDLYLYIQNDFQNLFSMQVAEMQRLPLKDQLKEEGQGLDPDWTPFSRL